MKKYTQFVANHRPLLFVIFIIITAIAIVGVFRIDINPNFAIFTTDDSVHKEYMERMDSIFPATDQIIFVIESDSAGLTPSFVSRIGKFQAFADSMENTVIVTGPVPGKLPMSGTEIDLNNVTDSDVKALNNYHDKLGQFSPVAVKDSTLYSIITVFLGNGFQKKDLTAIENHLRKNNMDYYASGNKYIQYSMIDYLMMIMRFLPFTALLLLLLTFRFQMKSFRATILSVLPAGIAALWTMGIIGYSTDISLVSVIAPIFTVVIGSADGLHFVSHVQDKRREGAGKLESIYETLSIVGIPLVITTITSIAGFMALLAMNTDAIKDMALFASIGIGLAGIATWYILPLILTGNMDIQSAQIKRGLTVNLHQLKPLIVIIVLIVLVGVSVYGSMLVKSEFNQLQIFKSYTDIQKSFNKIMEVNGGSMPVFALIESDQNLISKDNAETVLDFEQALKDSNFAGKTISLYDFIVMMNSNTGGEGYPDNPIKTSMIMGIMQNNMEGHSDYLYNAEANAAKVMIFPTDLGNENLGNIMNTADRFDKESGPDITVTGVQYLMKDLNDNMINNQGKTLLIAFILIFVSLLMSLRKVMPALISLLPIGITVLVLYGFLGLSGISLNIMTATIFSITIGVGIDYAVHYTSVWMTYRRKGESAVKAADMAFKYTSRPIITNALGLSIGLTALWLSPLTIHMHVSILMWVSMVCSVFVSLSLLPMILKRLG